MEDKQKALLELFAEMETTKLPLREISPLIPGEGNPDAAVLFIGEAGGYHESQQRRPFVGQAGKLLNKSLEDNGMRREDVWITNVVKARPPENRDPQPEEIEAYRPYLERELSIIQPRVIATLGRFAMEWFLGNQLKISRIHGTPRRLTTGIVIFPLFHPAAALRAGDVLKAFQEDFAKLAQYLKTLDAPPASINISENVLESVQPEQKPADAEQKKLF